jgi:hypothetical protein
MTPRETVILTRYVKALCPQQAIDEYTPNAWHDLLGDLSAVECRAAAIAVARRQPFVAPSEIIAECGRARMIAKPDWCGACDEQTRLLEVVYNGSIARCPACHPLTSH